MTHPSPTALEEKNAIAATDRDAAHVRTDHAVPSVVLAAVKACAASWVPDARLLGNVRAGDIVRAIAALEAEHSRMREALEDIESSHLPDQPAESSYDERGWAMMWIGRLRGVAKVALEVSSSRAEKAEAQLATRLPTEAQISYLLEVLAREGVANDGGDFMRRKISKAILALLSGAATPAPTAALTEDDVWLKPPPHFSPDPRWQRQPQSNEEWNAHKDTDRQFNAKRRLAFAGDVDDPRAPKCMALVSRLDLSVVLGRLTWLEARFENTRGSALPSTPEPAAKSPPQGAKE